MFLSVLDGLGPLRQRETEDSQPLTGESEEEGAFLPGKAAERLGIPACGWVCGSQLRPGVLNQPDVVLCEGPCEDNMQASLQPGVIWGMFRSLV